VLTVRPIAIPGDRLAAVRSPSLGRSLERIASGVRIHEAADDAAGLGVATDLRTDTRSLAMARRNIEDGMGAIHAAEGGLDEITDNLQRMRELAVAAASETLHDEERAYLNAEFNELAAEVDRIAVTTEFGGESLLARPAVDILLMADISNSMAAELPVFASELPLLRDRLETEGIAVRVGVAEVSTGASPIGDILDGSTTTQELTDDATAADAALSALGTTGPGAMDPYTAFLDQTGIAPVDGENGPEEHDFGGPAVQKIIIYASDTGRETSLTPVTESETASALANAGFRVYATTNTASHTAVFDEITDRTGGLLVDLDPAGANVTTLMEAIGDDIIARAGRTEAYEVQAGIHDSAHDRIELGIPTDTTTTGMGLAGATVRTATEARAALDSLDSAIADVSRTRSTLGATWNRLDEALDLNEAAALALTGAESRIRDADMADITSEAVAQQIARDAAVAARMQARQIQQSAIPALLG
jgi:flagellin